jgi:predicted Rossmann-fold nucleotide-binding protein
VQFKPNPIDVHRTDLYSAEELLGGFAAERIGSWFATLDGSAYRSAVVHGMPVSHDASLGAERALHDHAISTALHRVLAGQRVVAVMGGHRMVRGTSDYQTICALGSALTNAGFLVLTGGGPGAMEAVHLGARMSATGPDALNAAVKQLADAAAEFPDVHDLVHADGSINHQQAAALHAWQLPAFALADATSSHSGGIAIPTWHYGHEPPTPFASTFAKYYQNSIREDGLLAVAHHGVVFAPGGPGTVQEVFQDAAQNAYRSFGPNGTRVVSPMVFLDLNGAWTVERPIGRVLRFVLGDEIFDRFVHFCDSVTEAVAFLEETRPAEL